MTTTPLENFRQARQPANINHLIDDFLSTGNDQALTGLASRFSGGMTWEESQLAKERIANLSRSTNPTARTQLLLCLARQHGVGLIPDNAQNVEILSQLATDGQLPTNERMMAMRHLGTLYETGAGVAQDLQQAHQYYQQAVEQGHNPALVNLGRLYENGRGVAQDFQQAYQYYQQAVNQGHGPALVNLGRLYENGQVGGVQDDHQARQCYQKAAGKGDTNALFKLGQLYEEGRDVPQDEQLARQYYEQAAGDHGHSQALINLGQLHEDGRGGPQDDYEALRCYEQVAEQEGDANAIFKIALFSENGRGRPKHDNDPQRVNLPDWEQAHLYYQSAAWQGHAQALVNLGRLYEKGLGGPQNNQLASQCYQEAADQWHDLALIKLGQLYEDGRGVAQDFQQARQYYQQALEQGNMNALISLGQLYENGRGVAQDFQQARQYYQQALNQGHNGALTKLGQLEDRINPQRDQLRRQYRQGNVQALVMLGELYEMGIGGPQNYQLASQCYQQAYDRGDINALYKLSLLYKYEQSGFQDLVQARNYCQQAADQGHLYALNRMARHCKNGLGGPQDDSQAHQYLLQVAQGGIGPFMEVLNELKQQKISQLTQQHINTFRRIRHRLEQQPISGFFDTLQDFKEKTDDGSLNHLYPEHLHSHAYYHAALALGNVDSVAEFMANKPGWFLQYFRQEDQDRLAPDSACYQTIRQAFKQWQNQQQSANQGTTLALHGAYCAALAHPYFANGQSNADDVDALFQHVDAPESLTSQEAADVASYYFDHGYIARQDSKSSEQELAEMSLGRAAQFACHALKSNKQEELNEDEQRKLCYCLALYVSNNRAQVPPYVLAESDEFIDTQQSLLSQAQNKLKLTDDFSSLYQRCQSNLNDLANTSPGCMNSYWWRPSQQRQQQSQIQQALTEISDCLKDNAQSVIEDPETGQSQLEIHNTTQMAKIADELETILTRYQSAFDHRDNNDEINQIRQKSQYCVQSARQAGASFTYEQTRLSP